MTKCFDTLLPTSGLSEYEQNQLRTRAAELLVVLKSEPAAELRAVLEMKKLSLGMTAQAVRQVLLAQLGNPIQQWLDSGKLTILQSWEDAKAQFGDLLGEDLLTSIMAWHGSAADHDKFMLDMAGTGEGGHTYGWGHYLSTMRRVAEEYRKIALDRGLGGSAEGWLFKNEKPKVPEQQAVSSKAQQSISDNQLVAGTVGLFAGPDTVEQADILDATKWARDSLKEMGYPIQRIESIIYALENSTPSDFSKSKPGKLYQVELTPNHEDFLDFSKTLAEQSPQVQEAVNKVWQQMGKRGNAPGAINGGNFYHYVSNNNGGDMEASKMLLAAGIPGNTYLGDFAKNEGVGAQNYVIFDGNLISIKAKFAKYGLTPNGFYIPGKGAFLIADKLNKEHIKGTTLHEIFHSAINEDPTLLDGIPHILDAIDQTRKELAADPWVIEAERRMRQAGTKEANSAEEWAAYALGNYSNAPLSIQRLVDKLIAAVKMALVRMGIYTPKTISQADLLNIATDWLKRGAALKAMPGEAKASMRRHPTEVNKTIQHAGQHVAITKNPTAAYAYRIALGDKNNEIRVLTDPRNGDVYIAPASISLHTEISRWAGMPYEYENPGMWKDYDFESNTYILNADEAFKSPLFLDDEAAINYSLQKQAERVAPQAETFKSQEEAVQHLVDNLGAGIRNLVNNGVLQFTHGKAEWENAILEASTDQEWISKELEGLANHPDAEEMTLRGKVYFDLDSLAKGNLVRVAIHSIGEHFHLEKMLGAENYANLQNQIANRAKVRGSIEEKIWSQTAKNYGHLEVGSRPFIAEVIAKLGETSPPWYKRLLATVKAYLVRAGFGGLVKSMAGADMNALLLTSLRAAAYSAKKEAIYGEGVLAHQPMFSAGVRRLLAPNGKASNLNEMQWHQVRTPEFKAWFGDWENDPANASKVVDENGEPLVAYHGTGADIQAFDPEKIGSVFGADKEGFFFTSLPRSHYGYTGASEWSTYAANKVGGSANVIPVYLKISSPLTDAEFKKAAGVDLQKNPHRIDDVKKKLISIAKNNKNDGVINNGGADRGLTIIAFEPAQIKSAIGNTGAFSAENPNIMYSLPGTQVPSAVSLAPTPLAEDRFLRKVADTIDKTPFANTFVAKAVREAVEAPSRQMNDVLTYAYDGTKALSTWFEKAAAAIQGVDEETSNPWLAAKRYQSYTMLLNKEFDTVERIPFEQKMVDKSIKQEWLDDYMWARSAIDRNAKIAQRNPTKYPDGGAGMTTAEAHAILAGQRVVLFPGTADEKVIEFADPQLRADLEELSNMKDAIVHRSIDLAVEHGILPKVVGDSWKLEEPHYSPMFRVMEGDDFLAGAGTGTGYDVRGRVSKHAIGSGKPVSNILANVFEMRQKIIRMGVKSSGVGHAAFRLALQAPSPGYYLAVDPEANKIQYIEAQQNNDPRARAKLESLIGPELFATLEALAPNGSLAHIRLMYRLLSHRYYPNGSFRRALSMDEMQDAMAALPGTMLPNTKDAGHERFAKLVVQTIELGMSPAEVMGYINEIATPSVVNGQVKYVVNPALRNRPNVFATEVNGEVKFIFFNSRNKDAMQVARALKNLDATQLGPVLEKVAQLTRLFASLNTQYSLFFGPFNMMRDFHMAYLTTKHLPFSNYTQLASHAMAALKMFHPWFGSLIRAEREGKAFVPKNQSEAAMYASWEAAKKAGMPVGFTEMFGKSTERKDSIDKELKKLALMSKTGGGAWDYLRKNGHIFAQWLSDNNEAMELAMRLAVFKQAADSNLYSPARCAAIAKDATVDFNQKGTVAPQIGALYAFFNASIGGAVNIGRALAGPAGKQILTGSLILGALQAVILAAAGYDDDDPPETTRQKNLVIPFGGTWFAIPYPLGFHVLVNAGRIPMQAVLSNNKNQGAKPAFNMLSLLAEGVSPIGSGSVLQTIAPTAIDPIVAWSENKDWMGRSIYREDFNSLDPTPAYLRAKSGANPLAVWISKEVSNITGGDQYTPGLANIPPDALEYTLTQYAGAPLRDLSRASKWIVGGVTGDIPPMYTVPLLGRMTGKVGQEAGTATVFYRNIAELNGHDRELKGLLKDSPSAIPAYLAAHPEATMVKNSDRMYRKIGELHRAKREALEKGMPKEVIKQMGEESTKMMAEFNNRISSLTR